MKSLFITSIFILTLLVLASGFVFFYLKQNGSDINDLFENPAIIKNIKIEDLVNVVDKDKVSITKDLSKHPTDLEDAAKKGIDDYIVLKNYAEKNNIKIPESIQEYVLKEDKFTASFKLKELLKKDIIESKNLTIVQVIYQKLTTSQEESKSKVLSDMKIFVDDVKSKKDLNSSINNLKSKYEVTRVNVQEIEDYTCKSEDFNSDPMIVEAVKNLKESEVSNPIERKDFSFVVIYVNNSSNGKYCTFDDFINDNK